MALVSINIIADVPEPEFTIAAYKNIVQDNMNIGKVYDATLVVLAGEGERVNLQEP